MTTARRPGVVVLRVKASGLEFPAEIHVETGTHFEGYSRINPFAGYQRFAKRAYECVRDLRDA